MEEKINSVSINANTVKNAVLKRLIKEIENEGKNYVNAYNRTHSRHNRSK